MNCPKCNSSNKIKAGKTKGRQRYRCKECGFNYSVEMKSTAKPKSVKIQALHMYLEGLGFCAIGRILGVSNVSVLRWIRAFGQKVKELNREKQHIEMEHYTYLRSNAYTFYYLILKVTTL